MSQRSFFPSLTDLNENDRFVLFYDRQVIVRDTKYIWNRTELDSVLSVEMEMLVIESQTGSSVIAINTKRDLSEQLNTENRSLRSLLLADKHHAFSMAGKANQIMEWYDSHRFCGSCGCPTEHHPSQRVLLCPSCQQQYFPRINPCAIMLVVNGEEILLARHARFKSGFYSCLAGFIEVGETPEQTVVREVKEEVDIEVGNVRYAKSQSWPFPSQLMLGFYADYKSGIIVPEQEEIEEANWFNIRQLPQVPSADISVAGELIHDYVARFKSGTL